MDNILIDIEFTGLDNLFITDNEIIQLKLVNIKTGQIFIKNYNSKKKLNAHVQLEHHTEKYDKCSIFSKEEFADAMFLMGFKPNVSSSIFGFSSMPVVFFGFGVEKDKEMLKKYDINIHIVDIRTHFQRSEFAYRMATEGSGLEETYFIVTGEYPPHANHSDISEMALIQKLFEKMNEYKADEYMSIVPHGICAGMSISQYVREYRRQADGYRYNNSDCYSRSLSDAIEEMEQDEYDFFS